MESMNTKAGLTVVGAGDESTFDAKKEILSHASNELIFAVVGHVGSGNSEVATTLKGLLEDEGYEVKIIKAREIIEEYANTHGKEIPQVDENGKLNIADVSKYQNYGDELRKVNGHSAVAEALAIKIRERRAGMLGINPAEVENIEPDGKMRAYVLDSLRHPAEVSILRHIYQSAFILIGIVCEEEIREDRIVEKYRDAGKESAREFMRRDAKATEKFGQRVADTFHLSDFFVDNSAKRFITRTEPNVKWNVPEKLSRLIKIVTHKEIVRPDVSETAMYMAYGAKMRSACLSRQVGASVIDDDGNVLGIGANEVPKAGGGVYGEGVSGKDERCAYRARTDLRGCSSNEQQNQIIAEIIDSVAELRNCAPARKEGIVKEIRESRVGSLIEYSRAIHAEMDAIMSANRRGISVQGAKLFVTTFPCHYCARHLVNAGIDEVQFIEPYLKSKALSRACK
jgi:deoxycytidylate deaminase